jgi:hypothetical protein
MKRLSLSIALLAATATTLCAQIGGAPNSGINASLLKWFGDIKAFTAKGEVRMTDADGKEISSMPVTWMLLDGKLRTEMDMGQMKGASMPAEAVGMLKQTGMDKMHLLVTPEKKTTLVIYPGLKAYAPVPDAAGQQAEAKIQTTELAKETVEGHSCVKKKLSTTDANGKTEEAIVWSATDLKGFPIKMETQQQNTTLHMRFDTPSFDKPDAKLFEPPVGFTQHESLQGLMQAAMMKMMGGAK